MPGTGSLFVLAILAALVTVLYSPVNTRMTVLGIYRPLSSHANIRGHEVKIIPNTLQCEDVHYHAESGLLFTACQSGDRLDRLSWFPPLAIFTDPSKGRGGRLVVVDPKTFTSKELKITGGFTGPLVTHGIDVLTDPENPQLLHIFAVNHPPNAKHYRPGQGSVNTREAKSSSRIEVFTYELGSDSVEWRRSVRDSDNVIATPNDIFAISPTSFYVTNDHHFREGSGRQAEDILTGAIAAWTNMVFVRIDNIHEKSDPNKGQISVRVLRQLHNCNGLGRGNPNHPNEVIVTDAAGGVLQRARIDPRHPGLTLVDSMQLDSCVDNPSWYQDPYASAEDDASGYVLAGLSRGIDLADHWTDPDYPLPTIVWHVRANNGSALLDADASHAGWEKRAIWMDNGETIRSASAAVIVPIDPQTAGGKKQGWVFVTGFASENMIAARVDL